MGKNQAECQRRAPSDQTSCLSADIWLEFDVTLLHRCLRWSPPQQRHARFCNSSSVLAKAESNLRFALQPDPRVIHAFDQDFGQGHSVRARKLSAHMDCKSLWQSVLALSSLLIEHGPLFNARDCLFGASTAKQSPSLTNHRARRFMPGTEF